MATAGCLVIPKLWDEEVITISFHQLPSSHDVINMLGNEHAETHLWIKLAVEYKNQQKFAEFVAILEATNKSSNSSYQGGAEDLKKGQVMLAEYYYGLAQQETEGNMKDQLFHKAQWLLTGVQHGMKRKSHDESVSDWSSSGDSNWSLMGKRIRLPQ